MKKCREFKGQSKDYLSPGQIYTCSGRWLVALAILDHFNVLKEEGDLKLGFSPHEIHSEERFNRPFLLGGSHTLVFAPTVLTCCFWTWKMPLEEMWP